MLARVWRFECYPTVYGAESLRSEVRDSRQHRDVGGI
jgi:hypothetical protein